MNIVRLPKIARVGDGVRSEVFQEEAHRLGNIPSPFELAANDFFVLPFHGPPLLAG